MRTKKFKKKAQIAENFSALPSIAILIGVSIVMFSVMAEINTSMYNQEIANLANSTSTCNSSVFTGCSSGLLNMTASGNGLYNSIGAQFPLLGTITILGIIVLVLIGIFGRFFTVQI